MKITTEPRSDQWNAEDFIGGPRVFTVKGVKTGSAEQKYDIELEEGGGRVWRPPLTVLRLLVAAWGDDATIWPGRKVRLYRDPSITFGRDQVGGIRVSHVSHIDKPVTENLTATRGRRTKHTVDPLPADEQPTTQPTEPTAEQVASCTDVDQLRAWWKVASPERRVQIEQRKADLENEPTPEDAA